MPSSPSTAALIQAAAARLRQRAHEQKVRQERVRARLRWGLLAFAALLLLGLMADLRNLSRRFAEGAGKRPSRKGDAADIVRGLDDPRYVDPAGRFSLVPPRHWVAAPRPPGDFYDAVFRGPYGMDMRIQVAVTNGLTFDKLIEALRWRERALSADTHMDIAYVGPHRAVKRSARLFRNRVLMLDFVTGDLAHHVQFAAPPELYDEYEPVFLRLMETYEPGRIVPPAPAAP